MTQHQKSARKPHVVAADDPSVEVITQQDTHSAPGAKTAETTSTRAADDDTQSQRPSRTKWFAILLSALAGLAALAASLSFTSFVAHVVARDDWVGWLGFGLAAIAGVAFLVLALREAFGLFRLSRLTRLRHAIDKVVRTPNIKEERSVVRRLNTLYRGRDDLKWPLARLRDHQGDVLDAGELLALTDREVMVPLDDQARALILKSAKRVTVVTAISPMVWVALLYVVGENLRLIRGVASLYGARPGGVGALRLARMVFTHILATGGLAMTDDLLGQFLGQDLVRRLSRRLGEGVFNGALTARVGTAAVNVVRPVPNLESEPLRLRNIVRELVRNTVKPKSTE